MIDISDTDLTMGRKQWVIPKGCYLCTTFMGGQNLDT